MQPRIKEQHVAHEALYAHAFIPEVDVPLDLHEHNWDHVMMIPPGSIFDVIVNDQVTRAEGFCFVVVAAHQKHSFISRKEGSVAVCMVVLRDKNDWTTVVDSSVIPAGSKFSYDNYAPIIGGTPPLINKDEVLKARSEPYFLPGSPEPIKVIQSEERTK